MLRSFLENLMVGLNIIIKKKWWNNFKFVIIFIFLCKFFMLLMVRFLFIFMGENEILVEFFLYFIGLYFFFIL